MKITREELRSIVEEIVQEELYQVLPGLLKEVLSEVVSKPSPKKPSLLEDLELDEDEEISPSPVRSRSSLLELMDAPVARPRTESIPRTGTGRVTITSPQPNGTVTEIAATAIPAFLQKAMTRNYKDLLTATKNRNG